MALSSPSSVQIDVYSANDYSPRGNVTLPLHGPAFFVDMAACRFYKCLYLADAHGKRIVRLKMPVPPNVHKWKVDDIGYGTVISVTSSHDLLVMCDKSNRLKLFSTDGLQRMRVDLQPDIVSVTSAVELIPGHYLVTHGRGSDVLCRICLVNNEGKIVHRPIYGGLKRSSHKLMNCPKSVAVDGDGFVYVIEQGTNRLVVLSSTLEYIRCIKHDLPYGYRRMKMDKALKHVVVVTGNHVTGTQVMLLRLK